MDFFCYVKGSFDNGLIFDRFESTTFDFVGYVDCDYALTISVLFLVTSVLYVWVLFLERHPL